MFKIWYLMFMLNYPTHLNDHVSPKLTLQVQYCFSKWDTIGNTSALLRAEKRPYGPYSQLPHHLCHANKSQITNNCKVFLAKHS